MTNSRLLSNTLGADSQALSSLTTPQALLPRPEQRNWHEYANSEELKIYAARIFGQTSPSWKPGLILGALKDSASDELPGFNDRLKSWMPSIVEHRCSIGEPGGFFDACAAARIWRTFWNTSCWSCKRWPAAIADLAARANRTKMAFIKLPSNTMTKRCAAPCWKRAANCAWPR